MAVRFKERYGVQGHLWRMTVEDYQSSMPVVELGGRRSKLASIQKSLLSELVNAIGEKGEMGY